MAAAPGPRGVAGAAQGDSAMTCEEARDLLLERPSADSELQDHLSRCGDCAAAKEEMNRIDSWIAPLREVPVPANLLARRPRRPGTLLRVLPMAAAAAMLLAISLIVIFSKQPQPPPVPAAQEPAKSVGGLKLTCTVDKERYESKEPITFTATVENVSDHEIVFHKNEDSGLIGFPTFRITGAGQDWHLYVPPFQTLVQNGM